MANSLISMIKGNSTLINNTEVLNGQVLFDTDKKAILLDDNNTRSEYCGADKSNKNLAPIENGNTATRGYSAGSYVVWKEQLYKVLTQINSGTAFVVGTNIALDTVGAELTQINSDLVTKQNKTWNVISINASITNSYTYELPQSILSATDIYLFTGIPSYNDSKVLVRFFPNKDVAESYYYRQTDSYVIKFAFRYNDNTNALYISDYYVAGWGDGVTSLEKIFYR